MGWEFKDAQHFLLNSGLHPIDTYQSKNGRTQRSEYLSVTDDLAKENAVVYYLFGTNDEALLLELVLHKSNKEYQKQAEENFSKLVRALFFKATGIQLPSNINLVSPVNYDEQNYTLQIHENPNIEPATLFAFIAESQEFQDGMNIRENILYQSN